MTTVRDGFAGTLPFAGVRRDPSTNVIVVRPTACAAGAFALFAPLAVLDRLDPVDLEPLEQLASNDAAMTATTVTTSARG